MNHRRNNIQSATGVARASWKVLVCPVGAIVRTTQNSTTINVDAGHSFVAGDKFAYLTGGAWTFSTTAVQSVTATTIVMADAFNLVKADTLVNLGPDTSTGATPNYDASPVVVYTDMDGDDVISNSQLTTDSDGEYSYFYYGAGKVWELIRDSADAVQDAVKGWGEVHGGHNVADFGAACDGATDDAGRIQAALDAAEQLTGGDVRIPDGVVCSIESQLVMETQVRLIGHGASSIVRAHASNFPVDTALIKLGTTGTIFHCRIEHMQIDCNHVSGAVGVYTERVQEGCGIYDVRIANTMSRGFHAHNSGSPNPQNFDLREITVWFGPTAPATAVGIYITGAGASFRGIHGYTCDVSGSVALGAGSRGIFMEAINGTVEDCHIDHVDIGIDLGGAGLGCRGTVLSNIRGGAFANGTNGTSVIRITNESTNDNIIVSNMRALAAGWTNMIADSLNTVTITTATQTVVPLYCTSAVQFWAEPALRLGNNTDADVSLVFQRASGNKTLIWDESADSGNGAFVLNDSLSLTGTVLAERFLAGNATALVDGDFVLSAGWGDTPATVVVTAGGRDSRFTITVTSLGASQGANPTITFTFKDGAYSVAPIAVVNMNGGTATQVQPTWTSTTTALVITFPATPVDTETHIFSVILMG